MRLILGLLLLIWHLADLVLFIVFLILHYNKIMLFAAIALILAGLFFVTKRQV